MAIWFELRNLVRWLLRRSDPPPPPGTGQSYQAAEQAAARQRVLDQAQRLRETRWYCGAGTWASAGNVLGVIQLDVRAVRVGGSPEGMAGWIWVRGHNLECWRPSVACVRDWCVKVAVRAEALYDALAR